VSNFLTRTFTAAFIVIFIIGGFWLHPVSFFIAGLTLLIGTQYEYFNLISTTGVKPQLVPGLVVGALCYTLATLVAAGVMKSVFILLIVPLISVVMFTELYRRVDRPFDSLAHTLFSFVYIVLPFCLFPFSAFGKEGFDPILMDYSGYFSPGIILGFFLLLWANDTGAYLVGVTIGKHRLMERISPKKSWEGFIGGILVSAGCSFLIYKWFGMTGQWQWLVISLIISVTGTLGDLVESMLKRSIGVKDSGTILPGHGGFLDRFDSTIISFPFVFLFLTLFG